MTDSAIIAIAAAFTIAFCTMETIARQPETAKDVRSSLIIAMALMEALTIYGLLIAFMLVAKV